MLSLRHLRHVIALADTGHFGRAAAAVNLSQPAFSRSIQSIEQDLDLKLFEREGAIRLTEAGHFLVERARVLVAASRNLDRDLTLYRAQELGDIAFGMGPVPAATLLPRLLPPLRTAHPRVCMRVEVNHWASLLVQLRAESIEFFAADVSSIPMNADLHVEPLMRQSTGFCVRADHPLATRNSVDVAEVWAHGIACVRIPPAFAAWLSRKLDLPAGTMPPLALETENLPLLRHMAESTDTVLAMALPVVADDLRCGRLKWLPVRDYPGTPVDIALVSLRHRTQSPTARLVRDALQGVVRSAEEELSVVFTALKVPLPPGTVPAPLPGTGPRPLPPAMP